MPGHDDSLVIMRAIADRVEDQRGVNGNAVVSDEVLPHQISDVAQLLGMMRQENVRGVFVADLHFYLARLHSLAGASVIPAFDEYALGVLELLVCLGADSGIYRNRRRRLRYQLAIRGWTLPREFTRGALSPSEEEEEEENSERWQDEEGGEEEDDEE